MDEDLMRAGQCGWCRSRLCLGSQIWVLCICAMAHESWFPRASETGLTSARAG
ncbi:hypothetical protein PanWU01x14_244900, partial [Parasponia andersonii]